jgi:signal transduction histidine kinase
MEIIRGQEVIFSICMGLVAFLGRANPLLIYPNILWAFAAFMVFNLIYHLMLRLYGNQWIIPFISIAANSLCISLILGYSGAKESYFWPMYLLPLFTACLYLERRHVLFATLIPTGFLSYFYLDAFWRWDLFEILELLTKFIVLAFSAGVTMRVSFRERVVRKALEESRAQLDEMAKGMEVRNDADKMKTLSQMVGGIMHSVNNRLMIIQGSAELLLLDGKSEGSIRRDLERIESTARSCGRLTLDLMTWVKSDGMVFEETDLGRLMDQVLILFDHQVKRKRLDLSKEFPGGLPRMRVSASHLHQALLSLLFKATDRMVPGARLELKAMADDNGFNLRVLTNTPEPGDPMDGLQSCQHIMAQHGGSLEAKPSPQGMEFVVHLPPGKNP